MSDFSSDAIEEFGSTLNAATVYRLSAAIAVLVGGLVHLQLYFDGYRSLPDPNLGRSFIANGVASVVIAAALLVRKDALLRLAGIGVALATLGAFALSRTDRGIFGLRETGLNPSPQALIALIAEVAAIAALAISFLPKVGGGNTLDRRLSVPTAGIFAAGAVVLCMLWAQGSGASASTGNEPGVTISGFRFHDANTTVTAGTTLVWTNTDDFDHSVVAEDGSFHTEEDLSKGDTFSHTFDTVGTFNYVCGIHASMTGTVTVTD